MTNLFLLSGCPTAGKSTFINSTLLALYPNAVIISTDNYIEAVAVREGKTYDEVFSDNIKAANKDLNDTVNAAIKAGKDIIWDQTNLTSKVRGKKVSRFPKTYVKTLVHFNSDLETALVRNTNRPGKSIPEHILRDMHKNYESPTVKDYENFDSIITGN